MRVRDWGYKKRRQAPSRRGLTAAAVMFDECQLWAWDMVLLLGNTPVASDKQKTPRV